MIAGAQPCRCHACPYRTAERPREMPLSIVRVWYGRLGDADGRVRRFGGCSPAAANRLGAADGWRIGTWAGRRSGCPTTLRGCAGPQRQAVLTLTACRVAAELQLPVLPCGNTNILALGWLGKWVIEWLLPV